MIIELIRQFYDLPRCFRIMGENGAARYVQYSNAGIQPQSQGIEMGVDMGYRVPLFDVEITAQKQSPYSKMSQNELALQFYQAGFFNPQMADQALACLEMMDFDKKNEMLRKIRENDSRQQLMVSIAQENVRICAELDRKNAEDGITTNFTAQAQQKLAYIQQAMGAVKGTSAPPSEVR